VSDSPSNSLVALFADGLGVPIESLSDGSSPDNTPQWDSLAAMTLVSLIEDQYDVELSTRDIMKMQTIGLARSVLAGKGVVGL
jgi:acyl carrier protein